MENDKILSNLCVDCRKKKIHSLSSYMTKKKMTHKKKNNNKSMKKKTGACWNFRLTKVKQEMDIETRARSLYISGRGRCIYQDSGPSCSMVLLLSKDVLSLETPCRNSINSEKERERVKTKGHNDQFCPIHISMRHGIIKSF